MKAEERTLVQGPDGTIFMPAPGGRSTALRQRPAPLRAAKPGPEVDLQRLVAGVNPLLNAANTLLALVPELRATSAYANPPGLRVQLLERVREFESLARANGVPAPQVSAARYLLCSFIDEVIAATPWGANGVWGARTLLQEFHDEAWGGEKAFKLLERLSEDPATNGALLELFYVCLMLGFEGRWRGVRDGRLQLDALAHRLRDAAHLGHGSEAQRSLSLRWQGVATRGDRDLASAPLWVVFALGGVFVLGLLLVLNARLDHLAQPVFSRILALPAALQADRAAQPAKPRLAPLLQPEIAGGALEVRDEAQRSVLSLPADALFAAGSARVEARQADLLGRIAQMLKPQRGQIVVVGHSDNVATSSLQFPSNWHLSRERALAVMKILAQQGLPAERLRAEGRADVEPLAPNDTPEGRARNRRVEIDLLLPRPE
jgi:type VI secretion system protein ImpK